MNDASVLAFPLKLSLNSGLSNGQFDLQLNGPLTILLGPNGSGKTHLMRAIKAAPPTMPPNKLVRFVSAGRVGLLEQYRSISNSGYSTPRYEETRFGSYNQRNQRHAVETLEGDYQTLAVRPDIQLKVRERLRKLFKRDIVLGWENSQLKVSFSSETNGLGYSSGREASGLLHLVGLLTAVYDDEIGMLLLDEPEVSLHPQLQAFLLREIVSVAGLPGPGNKKLVVISTHSTEFLKIETVNDLPNLIFTTDVAKPPIQIDPSAGELGNRKISELISRMGQEHKLSFFADAPLLVEGPSDTIICAGLASKLGIHIEAGGSQLLPVVGKGEFPVVVKLLRLMGKTPLVLADADAFTDGSELTNVFKDHEAANRHAANQGHSNLIKMFGTVQRDFTKAVEDDWQLIEPLAIQTHYWRARKADDSGAFIDETKAKRRAAFAAIFTVEMETLPSQWQSIRRRLAGVLDTLELAGCFILRRGTIEAYYSVPGQSGDGKPAAAAEEVLAFKFKENAEVRLQYDDILRCLDRAAASEDISEAELIKELVLTVVPATLARLRTGTIPKDLNVYAKNLGNEVADLFDLQLVAGNLVVSLKSKVLDIEGFPFTLHPNDDVITKISDLIKKAR